MHIAACKITIHIPTNQNLKGKRRIVKSLCANIQNHFNVAVAEVENQDKWQLATIGISSVSNDVRQLDELLAKLISYIETLTGEFQLLDIKREIIRGA